MSISYSQIIHPIIKDVLNNKSLKCSSYYWRWISRKYYAVVDDGLSIDVNWDSWEMNKIFKLIMDEGNVPLVI